MSSVKSQEVPAETNLDENHSRKRKRPSFFGECGELSDPEERENIYSDNSMEDANYVPDSPKVIAKVKRLKPLPKNLVMQSTSTAVSANFDDLFNDIDRSVNASKPILASIECNNVETNAARINDENVIIDVCSKSDEPINSDCSIVLKATESPIENNITVTNASQKPDDIVIVDSCTKTDVLPTSSNYDKAFQELLNISKHILARIRALEGNLLKISVEHMKSNRSGNMFQPMHEQNQIFLKTIGLPFEEDSKFELFEQRLADSKFQKSVVDAFSTIPDPENIFQSSSTDKILKKFIYAIMSKELLSYYTWTGKTRKGSEKKKSFQDLVHINKLLHDLVLTKDSRFNLQIMEKVMVSKVLKYAYTYRKTIVSPPNENQKIYDTVANPPMESTEYLCELRPTTANNSEKTLPCGSNVFVPAVTNGQQIGTHRNLSNSNSTTHSSTDRQTVNSTIILDR
ncbi:uncharacterized protein LOC116342259 [Contarinia nasturtii]|uniref:uncharacterized protein LOC116342259 n=1 Tax=Contarinia nasturtii TaxID=265458 RepID=UPI0012D39E9A|nr:uncharacterized protein LOC116342259 [Contarinia nasturtii]